MRNLRNLVLIFLFIFFSSLCFAGMTIYFKDGSSKQVRKIQFKGEQADLYLTDGSVRTVAVNTLDLPSSGIFSPVGTYGGSELGTGSGVRPGTGISGAVSEQSKFKTQWEESTESVAATKRYGSIQEGDTVRVVSRNSSSVTVIYRDSGGNFKRLLIDSSTFFDVFGSSKQKAVNRTPVTPVIPEERVTPPVNESPQMVPAEPLLPKESVSSVPTAPTEKIPPSEPAQVESKSSLLLPLIISGAIIMAVIGFVVVTVKKRSAISIDPAKISKVEQEVRSYHLRNWLKQGFPSNQLVELCLNQFYSDNPRVLGLSLRILEGEPKSLVMASLMREGGKNAAQSEVIYEQLKSTVDLSRSLIEEVAHSTGLYPSDYKVPAGTSGSVAKAGVAPRSFSMAPVDQIVIVNRPTSVTVCAILLFLSAISTAVFIFSDIPYSDEVRKAIGLPGLYFSIVFTLACSYGYWTMKKWGVLLYALEPLLRFFMGVPTGLIAVPVLIVLFGMIHLEEMTWK